MRIASIIISFIAIGVSTFFGFSAYQGNKDIESYEKQYTDTIAEVSTYDSAISVVADSTPPLQEEKTQIEKQIDHFLKMEEYKNRKTAFLTFDDGPTPNTIKILDILKENNIKATFFVTGYQTENRGKAGEDILKRIVDEGHTLGIHSYSHVYNKIYKSFDSFFEDYDKVSDLVEEITGVKPTITRFPGGTASAQDFCKKYAGSADVYDQIYKELERRGVSVADWNVDSNDWKADSPKVINNVINGSKAMLNKEVKAALILMHEKTSTIKSLQNIIVELSNLGFEFEPLVDGGFTVIQRQVG